MNPELFNMDSINDIISSLSQDDIQSLKEMAQGFFPSQEEHRDASPKAKAEPAIDMESLTKIASVMSLLQSEGKDPRCDLLYALRPMLCAQRQLKVDQAAKMIRLFALIPKIKELDL